MNKHAGPIIAAMLLLLPMLYVGSYLALVVPSTSTGCLGREPHYPYRWGGEFAARLFWPLEQIDRTVRPEPWQPVVGMGWPLTPAKESSITKHRPLT